MKTIIAVLAVVLVATNAKVLPSSDVESQQTGSQGIQLTDLINQARANIDSITAQIQQQLTIPDQETVVSTIREQSTTLVNNIQNYVKNVSEEVKNKSPELERLWTEVKGKLTQVVSDINAQIPDAQEQVAQLQAKFQEGVQVLVKESDKAAKAISENSGKVQEDVAKFTKQAVDIAVQATQNLNTQLQQAAAPQN